MDEAKAERLYLRAAAILDRRSNGLAMPILRHLALRGHGWSNAILADLSSGPDGNRPGLPSRQGSPAWLYRRAHRNGVDWALRNLAISHFNANKLRDYRFWLAQAARYGAEEAAVELRYFQLRQPHGAARKIGRHRPRQRHDDRI